MEILDTYIPQDRRLALAQDVALPEQTHGAALFADISGFTPLTEALVRALGPQRGAEELPRQLNLIYDALITEIDRYGGSVIGFSGDAITCWFDDQVGLEAGSWGLENTQPTSSLQSPVSSLRATACALAIQATMQQFAAITLPDAGQVTLAIKVAVAVGAVRRFVVGDPAIQLVDALAGVTLDQLAAAEHQANKGEIVLDAHATAALGDAVTIAEWRTDAATGALFAVLAAEQTDPRLDRVALLSNSAAVLLANQLTEERSRPWLLPPVFERLSSGQGEFLTELRPAVALFLRFGGIDYDDAAAGEQLDAFIRWVQGVLASYGGYMLQLTIGDKGSYLYSAFGAPLAHEDNATRAAAAALELGTPPAEFAFITGVQIGISQGRMRTGAYGGTTRRTYGVLGDDVNLAARLMQHAAPGQVLVSLSARTPTGETFLWEQLPPLRVKGKTRPITAFRLMAEAERRGAHLQEPRYTLPMVGRAEELAIAEQKLELAMRGHGQIVAVTAEAGMGKSRLLAEIVHLANSRELAGYIGECQSYGTNNSYLVWEDVWQAFFGIDETTTLDEQIATLEHELEQIDPALVPRLPLLGIALNLPIPDNDLTRSLEAKLRKDSLEALLVDCVRSRARTTPLMFVLEDCHWLDPLSHDLIEVIGRATAELPVLIVVAYRPPDLERLQVPRVTVLPNCTIISLDDFSPDEAQRLIGLKLAQFGGEGELPGTLSQRIMERAQGNPFYIEELLNFLRDREIDPRDPQALAQLDLPSSLHSLILSRIDRLSESQRSTLKVASVIGRLFSSAMLWGAYPQLGEPQRITADLKELSRLDLTTLDVPEPELTYLFKHILTREVAYESLPFATRAALHNQIGLFIEQAYATSIEQHVDLLAFHFDHTENMPKRRAYLGRAGAVAAAAYANVAAIDYYRRLLPLLEDEADCLKVHLSLGELLTNTGQYDDALEQLQSALALAKTLGNSDENARACRWIARLHEHRGDYQLALDWIQQGLAALGERETTATAELLAIAGLISTRLGDFNQALAQADRCVQIAERLPDLTTRAFAYTSRSHVHIRRGNTAAAIADVQHALELYEQVGNLHGQALSFNGIGNTYFELSQWATASTYYRRARDIFLQTGDDLHRIFVDNNLGEIARQQGQLDEALGFFGDALRSLEQRGAAAYVIGVLHMNLGATHVRRLDIDEARRHIAESHANFARAQSRDYLPELYRHGAEVALVAGDLAEAQIQAQQAFDLARELTIRAEEGNSLCVLGQLAAAQGDYQQAEQYLRESIAILEEVGDGYSTARSQLELAEVYLYQHNNAAASAELAQAIPVFERLDAALDLEAAQALRDSMT